MLINILEKEDIGHVSNIWHFLEDQISNVSLDCKWDWVKTWLDHYGDTVDYYFFVGIEDNQPCGITLLTKEKQRLLPFPVNAYHIGTNGEPYKDLVRMINNKILVKNNIRKTFFQTLIKTIIQKFYWEEIVFDSFDKEDAEEFISILNKLKLQVNIERQQCPFFDLELSGKNKADILTSLSYDTRYSIRRSLKVFDNNLTTEWAEDKEHALDILEELRMLYRISWEKLGRDGVFSSERFNNFQTDIIKKFIDRDSIILFRVRDKKYGTLGCLYLFISNGIAYGYQLGLNNFEDAEINSINKKRLRVGFIVHTLCMQECLKRGINAYNFSTGIYPYKKELTNNQSEIITISVRRNYKPLLRDNLINLYTKLDINKKSPLAIKLLRKFI